ncbi:hypothetical protein SCLCIDRAFT_547231 [Scleroderma citrinum Foug A]|uniref:Uncharacterized protein n=1 Tax=Scleroderma citrinum Foug A TaxID=1036808 RepID=A0A0C3D970_9AGAM|nr:hypothetical protein SCLCIDRAFT_547231 [Scleroderma citrinum Foug A]
MSYKDLFTEFLRVWGVGQMCKNIQPFCDLFKNIMGCYRLASVLLGKSSDQRNSSQREERLPRDYRNPDPLGNEKEELFISTCGRFSRPSISPTAPNILSLYLLFIGSCFASEVGADSSGKADQWMILSRNKRLVRRVYNPRLE